MGSKRQREHNEWFRTVSLGGRKSCPECGEKLEPTESIWSWGEYVRAKWRTVTRFCMKCFATRVAGNLNSHTDACGCVVNLVGYQGEKLPVWLTLEKPVATETCVTYPLEIGPKVYS